jgi:hypothetical protein
MAFTIDKEKVEQKIALISKKIDADVDPRLLNEYRVLFKRGFSFFRRSWAAACLLMLYDQGQGRGLNPGGVPGRRSREGERAPGRFESSARRENGENSRQAAPRSFLAEDESRRLFISIGRNRHVFPREILGLIITRAQVDREDIGIIRILDSYSFVQVRDTVADAIIEALNGAVFRGRTITANYARIKREEGQDEGGPTTAPSTNPSAEPEAFSAPIAGDSPEFLDTPAETVDSVDSSGPADAMDPVDAVVEDTAMETGDVDPDPGILRPGDSEQGDDPDDKEGV